MISRDKRTSSRKWQINLYTFVGQISMLNEGTIDFKMALMLNTLVIFIPAYTHLCGYDLCAEWIGEVNL